MARGTEPDKAALLAEIAATRVQLSEATENLREAMDFPARARRSVREHRGRWIAGAVATGLLLTLLIRRKKVVYVERSTGEFLGKAGKAGLLLTALKIAGSLGKPLLGELAKARLTEWVTRFAEARHAATAKQTRH